MIALVARLRSGESPYKPRFAAIWKGAPETSGERKPDLQGHFRNASLTHLGCLEVILLDARKHATEIAFIPLDDLRGAIFAGSGSYRMGRLFFENGRPDEVVLVPLLYGISRFSPHVFDQDGTMTRFICNLDIEGPRPALSIGVGHQDILVQGASDALVGLGSLGQFITALSVDDSRFEQKCMARGLEPQSARRAMEAE